MIVVNFKACFVLLKGAVLLSVFSLLVKTRGILILKCSLFPALYIFCFPHKSSACVCMVLLTTFIVGGRNF